MHIGITEEIFATERLAPERKRSFEDLWPPLRGGSTPDDMIPATAAIRQILEETRKHLLETLNTLDDEQLDPNPTGDDRARLDFAASSPVDQLSRSPPPRPGPSDAEPLQNQSRNP